MAKRASAALFAAIVAALLAVGCSPAAEEPKADAGVTPEQAAPQPGAGGAMPPDQAMAAPPGVKTGTP